MGFKGVYLSKSRIIILVTTVVILLVAEGLIVGLVGRPECSTVTVVTQAPTDAPTSSSPSGTTEEGPTESPGPWSNVRLPDNLVPMEYDVELRPVLETDSLGRYLFHGSSSVTYTCKKATNYIILHSNKLNYTKDDVELTEEGSLILVKSMMFYQPNDYVVLETEDPCVEGRTYKLSFSEFMAELSGDLRGLYRSEYDAPDGKHKVIATSQMQVTGARETFPCFDEPALKANFTVTIWYRATTGEFAASNMKPASYADKMIDGDLWNSTKFQKTVPMSTYLLAMMVSDFTFEETFTPMHNIQTRIYARKEAVDNGEVAYASKITPKILEFFENYFNVLYPLPKSDQVAVPDFGAGAMENWGLVIYRETYLLYSDAVSSVFDKRRCTNVVAHELAHQWFGNLVSPAWWDDVWLNEGFASYVAYLGEKEAQPTWKSMERFLLDENQVAMEVDALTSSHPLVQPVASPAEISSQFDDISYSKGACVLRMISNFMKEENFVAGLTTYLNDLAYDAATHDDLFQHWEDQANKVGLVFPADLSKILETWTLQMGYPVINIVRNAGTNAYVVTQEYFLLDSNATVVHTPGSMEYGYQWYVPLIYQTSEQIGSNRFSEIWLEPDQTAPETILESDFLLANIDGIGYYRVNYDEDTWKKLTSKLRSSSFKEISEGSRAQLIDDAFNLARPGRLPITVGMDMSKYLEQEDGYTPWKTFMDRAKFIEYMIGRSKNYGIFSKYIVQLIEPTLYFKYGWEDTNTTDEAQIERMTMQVGVEGACYYGSDDCNTNATRLFKEWMDYPSDMTIISNTYRGDVYCAAIRNGGTKEWNFAWDRHNNIVSQQEKASLRYGLSCSKEPWILNRYMRYCVDPTLIRRQDSLRTCLQYIGAQEYGRDLAWAFVVNNWDSLVEEYGGGITFDSLIEIITRRFSTEYDLHLLEDFKETTPNLGTAVRAVDQAIERTKTNIRWRLTNEAALVAWLEENVAKIA